MMGVFKSLKRFEQNGIQGPINYRDLRETGPSIVIQLLLHRTDFSKRENYSLVI